MVKLLLSNMFRRNTNVYTLSQCSSCLLDFLYFKHNIQVESSPWHWQQRPYRGVPAVPAAVSAVLSNGAWFGADARRAAANSCGFGWSSGCNSGAGTGHALHAGSLLHFHPNRLQAESRWRWQVPQVLQRQKQLVLLMAVRTNNMFNRADRF